MSATADLVDDRIAVNVVRNGAYDILSRSHVLTILDDTSDIEIPALLDALRAAAAGASSEVRREVHFHALKALRETGHADVWAAALDRALGVRYGPADPSAPPGSPRRPTAQADADPSLRLWRRELSQGVRTVHDYDALWLAACYESTARTLDAQEASESAARCRAKARQIILEAARQRPKSA